MEIRINYDNAEDIDIMCSTIIEAISQRSTFFTGGVLSAKPQSRRLSHE